MPGEHRLMGIGDGFIPPIGDMAHVDRVLCATTEEAHETAERIRSRHGYCVGRSSGANTAVSLRLAAEGAKVATLWPDCSDRYVSLGLSPPSAGGASCPLKAACAGRGHEVLGSRSSGPA